MATSPAQSLGDEKGVVWAGECRRVELDELQVGQLGARVERDDQAGALTVGRGRRPSEQSGIPAGGEHGRATGHLYQPVTRAKPATRDSITGTQQTVQPG